MNKDDIKGTGNDTAGRIKRQVGEWTGDEDLQAEGAKDQAKGKLQKGWAEVKDKAHELKNEITGADSDDIDRDRKDRDVA